MPVRKAIANFARRSFGVLPFSILQRLTARHPCLPVYHAVAEVVPEHVKHLNVCRDPKSFRDDLDWMLRRFTPVSLTQIEDWIVRGKSLPGNAFHLTVDDGLREAVEVVAPACKSKGVPVTFFLTTRFLDNKHLFDRHLASLLYERILRLPSSQSILLMQKYKSEFPGRLPDSSDWKEMLLRQKTACRPALNALAGWIEFDQVGWLTTARPYATSEEVAKLLDDGFSIGAHTLDHPLMPEIELAEQVRQTAESVKEIESRFKVRCSAFAFPYGVHVAEWEYYRSVRECCSVELYFGLGHSTPSHENLLVPRIPLDASPGSLASRILQKSYARRLELYVRRQQEFLIGKKILPIR